MFLHHMFFEQTRDAVLPGGYPVATHEGARRNSDRLVRENSIGQV